MSQTLGTMIGAILMGAGLALMWGPEGHVFAVLFAAIFLFAQILTTGISALVGANSLVSQLIVANALVLAYMLYSCAGSGCPNKSIAIILTWHAGISLCAALSYAASQVIKSLMDW